MGERAQEWISYAEYLSLEEASEIRHEWLDGQVVAMAGGSVRHALLASNAAFALRKALAGRPCRVFASDLRARVQATGLGTYPDLSVVCGRVETDPEDDHALVNPVVLVEVLSPSTARYDRTEKFDHYKQIPSLQEYLMLAQDTPRALRYRRLPEGGWRYDELGAGDSVELSSLGVARSVDELYEGAFEVPGG